MRSPFVKLANPSTYIACSWDLSIDSAGRTHWVDFFKRHLNTILKLAIAAATSRGKSGESVQQRAAECQKNFNTFFDLFASDPHGAGKHGCDRVTILTMDIWRDRLLRDHGFVDAFVDLKAQIGRAHV